VGVLDTAEVVAAANAHGDTAGTIPQVRMNDSLLLQRKCAERVGEVQIGIVIHGKSIVRKAKTRVFSHFDEATCYFVR
jgi:hypothetical protein